MRVVFYTSGTTGSGRLVRGISIGNAIHRANLGWDYTIVNMSPFAHLADLFGYKHIEIPPEEEDRLSENTYAASNLYNTIISLNPDVLLVDLLWFPLSHFINELPCKKIFLCHYVRDEFFRVHLRNQTLCFRPGDYHSLLAIEPFRNDLPFDEINPIVIRNRNEILSRDQALIKLNIMTEGKNCLYAFNGNPGDFERNREKYSYLESEGYTIIRSTNYDGGLFPVVDYFNAFDLVICSGGYNQYWEARYFEKKALFETIQGRFSSQEKRIKMGKKLKFTANGADQLVDIIKKF